MDRIVSGIAQLAGESGYTPGQLASDLATGVATVGPWVGAGIGGGVLLMFLFMGIRKGFGFFKSLAR